MIPRDALHALHTLLDTLVADGVTAAVRARAEALLGPECAKALMLAHTLHGRPKTRQRPRPGPRPQTLVLARAYLAVAPLIQRYDKASRSAAFNAAIRHFWNVPGARAAFPKGRWPVHTLETAIMSGKGHIVDLARKLATAEKQLPDLQIESDSCRRLCSFEANDQPTTEPNRRLSRGN